MKNLFSILAIIALLSLTEKINAQEQWQIQGKSLSVLKSSPQISSKPLFQPFKNLQQPVHASIPSLKAAIVNPHQPGTQPKGWSYQELGLFCKLEVKMEKAFKMPVKFRLGEVQYVEKMEGKKGYVLPKPNVQ